MSTILTVSDLHVTFKHRHGSIKAVSGVDFTLKEGEVLGIVGESGCGKSAMAKALTQILPEGIASFQGQVLFEGKDLLKCKESTLRSIRGKEIGMIFQDPMTSLNPSLTVGEQLIEGYLKHHPHVKRSDALAHTIEMLKAVGVPNPEIRIFEYPHTFSGGMRQKLTIAMALTCRPKILIADEPTTALDVTVQAQILSFMRSFQKSQNTSVLLITHDLSVVAGFCTRVMVMYAGKIVETAPIEELFYNPKHPYTQKLLKAIPRIDLAKDTPLIPIEGSPPSLITPLEGCAFHPRCCSAMPICREKAISLLSTGQESHCRCWLYKQESS